MGPDGAQKQGEGGCVVVGETGERLENGQQGEEQCGGAGGLRVEAPPRAGKGREPEQGEEGAGEAGRREGGLAAAEGEGDEVIAGRSGEVIGPTWFMLGEVVEHAEVSGFVAKRAVGETGVKNTPK